MLVAGVDASMSLLSLPKELLLVIGGHLASERDISSLSRTNHHLHSLLTLYLYRRNVQYGGSSALRFAAHYGPAATARLSIDAG
jgi:hypothetical protein